MIIKHLIIRNGIDLLPRLKSYLQDCHEYTIIVPYIKNPKLLELLEASGDCSQMVVRWEPRDILQGASDLEVFETCRERGITLYRNPRIHLKAYVSDSQRCFMGSPNISERALSDGSSPNYNYELATVIEQIDFETNVYFPKHYSGKYFGNGGIHGAFEVPARTNRGTNESTG